MATQQKYIQLNLFQEAEDNEKELESPVCQKKVRLDGPVRKASQVRLPQSISSDKERQRVHLPERFAHHPPTRGRLHRQTTGSSRYSERRQADTNARPSSVPCPARHRLLLPRMLLQMASHPHRTRTHQGRTAICRSRTDGMDRNAEQTLNKNRIFFTDSR